MIIEEIYNVIMDRKANPQDGSYTCYLFEKGQDKILKKIGEESAECIIAAKNTDNTELANEICDLAYHVLVLMAEKGIELSEIEKELKKRVEKIGNLKKLHKNDKNS